MSGAEAWTLCVDFGTAYSKAAAAPSGAWAQFEPGLMRPLTVAGHGGDNPFLLDSALFIDKDRLLFGRAALDRAGEYGHTKRTALRSFKTLLSVSDLDRALNTNAPASIDPHRIFQMRDLVVLYLAYLTTAVERALEADPVLAGAALERRYAAPAWRGGDAAGMHDLIVRLFGEAEALRQAIDEDALLSPSGLSLKAVGDTLPGALAAPRSLPMGLIFEASAAAAYSSIGLADSASHLIVVDMGAGTTDIAGLARTGSRIAELPQARVTLKQAGDFIDRVIANGVLDASSWAKTEAHRGELWRALMLHMRDIKESLFYDGRAMLRHDGRTITINVRDVERDRDYREFVANLGDAYAQAFAVVRDDALARGRIDVQVVAVGGGAGSPAVQSLLNAKQKNAGKLRVTPRPATPDWAHDKAFRGNLAPVFPQLAIALGGALAPEAMLAVRSEISPAAAGRNGIPAGPD